MSRTVFQELVPPTSITAAVWCRLLADRPDRFLVVAKKSVLEAYALKPVGSSAEGAAAAHGGAATAVAGGVPTSALPTDAQLQLVASFRLWGSVESMSVVELTGRAASAVSRVGPVEALLLSFKTAKLSLVALDPWSFELKTIGLMNFEFGALGAGTFVQAEEPGFVVPPGLAGHAQARVDPAQRCAVMLVSHSQLAVVPFRRRGGGAASARPGSRPKRATRSALAFRYGERPADWQTLSDNGPEYDAGADEEEDDDDDTTSLAARQGGAKPLLAAPSGASSGSTSNTALSKSSSSSSGGAGASESEASAAPPEVDATVAEMDALTLRVVHRPFLLDLASVVGGGGSGPASLVIRDMAFLEPSSPSSPPMLALLVERALTSASRLASLAHTVSLVVVSLDTLERRSRILWYRDRLPHDVVTLVPVPAPTCGVLLLSTNAALYFNDSSYAGLALNAYAASTVDVRGAYPLDTNASHRHEFAGKAGGAGLLPPPLALGAALGEDARSPPDVNLELDSPRAAFLSPTECLVTLADGSMHVCRLHGPVDDGGAGSSAGLRGGRSGGGWGGSSSATSSGAIPPYFGPDTVRFLTWHPLGLTSVPTQVLAPLPAPLAVTKALREGDAAGSSSAPPASAWGLLFQGSAVADSVLSLYAVCSVSKTLRLALAAPGGSAVGEGDGAGSKLDAAAAARLTAEEEDAMLYGSGSAAAAAPTSGLAQLAGTKRPREEDVGGSAAAAAVDPDDEDAFLYGTSTAASDATTNTAADEEGGINASALDVLLSGGSAGSDGMTGEGGGSASGANSSGLHPLLRLFLVDSLPCLGPVVDSSLSQPPQYVPYPSPEAPEAEAALYGPEYKPPTALSAQEFTVAAGCGHTAALLTLNQGLRTTSVTDLKLNDSVAVGAWYSEYALGTAGDTAGGKTLPEAAAVGSVVVLSVAQQKRGGEAGGRPGFPAVSAAAGPSYSWATRVFAQHRSGAVVAAEDGASGYLNVDADSGLAELPRGSALAPLLEGRTLGFGALLQPGVWLDASDDGGVDARRFAASAEGVSTEGDASRLERFGGRRDARFLLLQTAGARVLRLSYPSDAGAAPVWGVAQELGAHDDPEYGGLGIPPPPRPANAAAALAGTVPPTALFPAGAAAAGGPAAPAACASHPAFTGGILAASFCDPYVLVLAWDGSLRLLRADSLDGEVAVTTPTLPGLQLLPPQAAVLGEDGKPQKPVTRISGAYENDPVTAACLYRDSEDGTLAAALGTPCSTPFVYAAVARRSGLLAVYRLPDWEPVFAVRGLSAGPGVLSNRLRAALAADAPLPATASGGAPHPRTVVTELSLGRAGPGGGVFLVALTSADDVLAYKLLPVCAPMLARMQQSVGGIDPGALATAAGVVEAPTLPLQYLRAGLAARFVRVPGLQSRATRAAAASGPLGGCAPSAPLPSAGGAAALDGWQAFRDPRLVRLPGVSGWQGWLALTAQPLWLLGVRGSLAALPLPTLDLDGSAGAGYIVGDLALTSFPLLAAAPFSSPDCPDGLLLCHRNGTLQFSAVHHAPWPVPSRSLCAAAYPSLCAPLAGLIAPALAAAPRRVHFGLVYERDSGAACPAAAGGAVLAVAVQAGRRTRPGGLARLEDGSAAAAAEEDAGLLAGLASAPPALPADSAPAHGTGTASVTGLDIVAAAPPVVVAARVAVQATIVGVEYMEKVSEALGARSLMDWASRAAAAKAKAAAAAVAAAAAAPPPAPGAPRDRRTALQPRGSAALAAAAPPPAAAPAAPALPAAELQAAVMPLLAVAVAVPTFVRDHPAEMADVVTKITADGGEMGQLEVVGHAEYAAPCGLPVGAKRTGAAAGVPAPPLAPGANGLVPLVPPNTDGILATPLDSEWGPIAAALADAGLDAPPPIHDPLHEVRLYVGLPPPPGADTGPAGSGSQQRWALADTFKLDRYEHVLSMKEVPGPLSMRSAARPASAPPDGIVDHVLLVGTGFVTPRGEDTEPGGRVLAFKIEPPSSSSSHLPKLRLLYADLPFWIMDTAANADGAITAVSWFSLGDAPNLKRLVIGSGQRMYVMQWSEAGNDPRATAKLAAAAARGGVPAVMSGGPTLGLETLSRVDCPTWLRSVVTFGPFLFYGDLTRSCALYHFLGDDRSLRLDGRHPVVLPVASVGMFIKDKGSSVGLVVNDTGGNTHVLAYKAKARMQLIKWGDFNTGSEASKTHKARLPAPVSLAPAARWINSASLMGNYDGGVSAVLPVSDAVFRRLLGLQRLLSHALPHAGGLNARVWRLWTPPPPATTELPRAQQVIDGPLLARYFDLDARLQRKLAGALGLQASALLDTLRELQLSTLLF